MARLGVRAVVRRRAKHRCEICGKRVKQGEHSLHHRKMKRIGGKDTVTNLIYTHRSCHDDVHRDEERAGEKGLVAWVASDVTPMLLHRSRWVLLRHDGTYVDLPEAEALGYLSWVSSLCHERDGRSAA